MAAALQDTATSQLAKSTIEPTLIMMRLRSRYTKSATTTITAFLPSLATIIAGYPMDVLLARRKPLKISPSMTYDQLKDAIAEVVLEVFDLEVRGARIPPGQSTNIASMTCIILVKDARSNAEAVNALLGINGPITWAAAMSWMQAGRGSIEIHFRFAKKRTEPLRCTVQ
jgi:hypothetical protein